MASILSNIGGRLASLAGLLYGCLVLTSALLWSATQKEFWFAPDTNEKRLRAQASRQLWSLDYNLEGITHNFLTLSSGTQLHYLAPQDLLQQAQPTVVVFLHGFPDSAHLFTRKLRSNWANKARLVALDLPGCGGSDSLDRYGPSEVLNAIAEAIEVLKDMQKKALRRARSQKELRCILVGHDWGGIIAFRLAAETRGLVDHAIGINSVWPAYAEEQMRLRISETRRLLAQGQYHDARLEFGPVLAQLKKSSYTYMLTLPLPLAKLIPRLTICLIKFAHMIQYQNPQEPTPLEIRLAMAHGPSLNECQPSSAGRYGESVRARATTEVPGDWDGRVKLYTDGLLREKWSPSYPGAPEIIDKSASPEETLRFQCPVDIIFGMQDIALNPAICVDGIEKYFVECDTRRSEQKIVKLPNCGHWSILEEAGVRALDLALAGVLGGF